MSDLDTKIRHVRALLAKTVERGAFPAEAEVARRLAQKLIKRHGLETHFNANGKPANRGLEHDADPVRAAADRFWDAMRASGASDDAIRRERARWERERTSKARTPSEENFERAQREWERMAAQDSWQRYWDDLQRQTREWEAEMAYAKAWADDAPPNHANCRNHHAKPRRKAARAKDYKGVHGTVRAVIALGGKYGPFESHQLAMPVSAKMLAEFYGGITEDAAHGRLWRAQMAGLLKKVAGGFVVA